MAKHSKQYVVEHAKEIAERYLHCKNKATVSKEMGLSVICIDRALLISGHPEFVPEFSKKLYRYNDKIGYQDSTDGAIVNKPTFEQMMDFVVEAFSRAERTSQLEKEVKELQEKIRTQTETIEKCYKDYDNLKALGSKWKLLAESKNSFIVTGD